MTRSFCGVLACGVVAVALAGCGGSARRVATISLEECTFGAIKAQCGTLRVPEAPASAAGKRIPIAVAVVKARDPKPSLDPLFYFAGWGSAAIEDDLKTAVPMLARVNEHRDLVFIDQRGTGRSNALVCDVPRRHELERGEARAVTEAARRCAARIGPNLRYYTTAVAVDDFDAVRVALGYDKVNVYGGSYGGTTGQAYLLRHGAHVRAMVLDGASLLDVRIFERAGTNAQRALELLFLRCAADRACHAAFPDPAADYRRVAAHLRRAPIWIATRNDPVDAIVFADTLDELVAYTPSKPVVPAVLRLAATGRLSSAASVLAPEQDTTARDNLAYMLLIQCSEPWASRRRAETTRLSAGSFIAPLLKRSVATIAAVCRGFPRGLVPRNLGQRVRSAVPVLFLTGAEDPADPPANVKDAQRELPNARVVVFPAAGHGQLHLDCAQELIDTFVSRGSASNLDASCAQTAAELPFVTHTG